MRSLLYLFLIVAQWVPKSFIVEGSVSCVPFSCACDECPNMNVFCASSRAHCSDCAGNYCVSPTPSPSTAAAKESSAPSQEPVASPTRAPTEAQATAAPSQEPAASPTRAPTEAQATAAPSQEPAASPTRAPTEAQATAAPSQEPAASPTRAPTQEPVASPTRASTEAQATEAPSQEPAASPTRAPTEAQATAAPSQEPAASPTQAPTQEPVASPTRAPTQEPVASPTRATTEKAQASRTPAVPSAISGGVGGGDDGKASWGLGSVLAVLIIGCFAKLVLVIIAEDGEEKIAELKGPELQPAHGGGGDGSSPIVEMVDNSKDTAAPKKSTGAEVKKTRRPLSSKMAMKRAFSFTPGIRMTTHKSENNGEIAWNSAATAGLSSNVVSDGGIGQEIRSSKNGEHDGDGNPIALCAMNEEVEEGDGEGRVGSRSQRPPADEETQFGLV